jgi:magnesium-transporting ATPase (P-type)
VVDIDEKTGEINYQASSPDELALIQGAKQCGMVLKEKNTEKMVVLNEITGETEEYFIKAEFPFDSTRKRMTLLVKFKDQWILMCKGADSIIIPRINFGNENDRFMLDVQRYLLDFAKEGLRTLVVG